MLTLTVTTASKAATNAYGWRLGRDHATRAVRFVRGRKMRTLGAALDEIAAALQFPCGFTNDSAQFTACLGDLGWLGDHLILVICDANEVLTDEPAHKPLFYGAIREAEALFSAADNLQHPDRTAPALFQILLQCDPASLDRVLEDAKLLGEACAVVPVAEMDSV